MNKITSLPIEKHMADFSYDYAIEVLEKRSFCDIRDGLKPVERRVLYSMLKLNATAHGNFKKSARIIGETMGLFHPHGDSSIYQCLVNMGVPFKNRCRHVEPQGNFGNLDGDSAAAMRYTEAKLSELATDTLFNDLDKNVVDFVPNYSDEDFEPIILPVTYPLLWVNGTSGIGWGYASEIPTHNLLETIDCVLAYQNNENISTDEIIQIMPAPDFPTGGIVYNLDGYRQAIETGTGKINVKCKHVIEDLTTSRSRKTKKQIVITELPYGIFNKEKLIEKLRETVLKNIQLNNSIEDIKDQSSDDTDIRIVFILTQEGSEHPDLVFNQLCKLCKDLTPTITYNCNVIGHSVTTANDGLQPPSRMVNLKTIFKEFLLMRQSVIKRRTQFLLDKANKELHKLQGLMKVLADLDKAIEIIKSNHNAKSASEALQQYFDLDDIQAQSILRMQLQHLTSTELDSIKHDYETTVATVEDLNDLLVNEKRINKIIKNDLLAIKKKYGKIPEFQRKTTISYETETVEEEHLVKQEECVVLLKKDGYICRNKTIEKQQNLSLFNTNTHEQAVFLTEDGTLFGFKVWNIPETERHISNIVKNTTNSIVAAFGTNDEKIESEQLVIITQQGKVKRTATKDFAPILKNRPSGIVGCVVPSDDKIIRAFIAKPSDQIILATEKGQLCRIQVDSIKLTGKTANMTPIIKFKNDDKVTDAEIMHINPDELLFDTKYEDNYVLDQNGDKKIGKYTYRIDGKKEIKVLNNTHINNKFQMKINDKLIKLDKIPMNKPVLLSKTNIKTIEIMETDNDK